MIPAPEPPRTQSERVRALRSPWLAIVAILLERRVGAVPVVDGDGIVVGVVSYIDVLRHLARREERRAA